MASSPKRSPLLDGHVAGTLVVGDGTRRVMEKDTGTRTPEVDQAYSQTGVSMDRVGVTSQEKRRSLGRVANEGYDGSTDPDNNISKYDTR